MIGGNGLRMLLLRIRLRWPGSDGDAARGGVAAGQQHHRERGEQAGPITLPTAERIPRDSFLTFRSSGRPNSPSSVPASWWLQFG